MSTDNIINLFEKYIAGTASASEVEQLSEITDQYSNEELADILEPIALKIEQNSHFKIEDWESVIRSILAHPPVQKAKIISVKNWYKVAAAAVIVLLVSIGGYFYFNNKTQKQIAQTKQFKNDVTAPISNKATITLANGNQILLDSAGNGTLAKEGNVNVVKLADGQIAYNGTSSEVQYNTVSNPKGSNVVNLTLSDGSKLWLNSESSIKFPVAFIGSDRKVEITGEAYFEVTHDAARKFLVEANGVTTEVLGTHFNVNSYSDEDAVRVTLLEGSVKVTKGSSSGLLKPGQQAQVASEIKVVRADIDETMAWKNGLFSFTSADIQTVMRQLARWYDVEVSYQGMISKDKFTGEIDRNITLQRLLENLAKSRVHFRIEDGKKIVILP